MTLQVAGFLTAWDKLGIMALGGAFVGLTVLVVVCAVGPGCCLYRIWHGSGKLSLYLFLFDLNWIICVIVTFTFVNIEKNRTKYI